MEVIGRIKMIDETKAFGANGFRKREVVITTDEQYPQHIMVEFTQDKCDLLDNYRVGDSVKVGINLRGREWVNPQGETKYFNSIQGWRVEKDEPTHGYRPDSEVDKYNQNHQQTPPGYGQAPGSPSGSDDDDDGLPF